MKNLYDSHYDKFFLALGRPHSLFDNQALILTCLSAATEQTLLKPNRLLAPHARFYVREMRISAYNQLLESYRSLTLDSLARSFGVSTEFVDRYVLVHYRCSKHMYSHAS